MSEAFQKIAKILRSDPEVLAGVERRLSKVTGKQGAFDAIIEENESLIRNALLTLGAAREANANEILEALISKVEADDYQIFKSLGNPNCKKTCDCQKVAEAAYKVVNPPRGFFLKFDKAKEILLKEPPRQVMSFLGYDSAEKMLANEDLAEIMSALRFVEGNEWLNRVFFKHYETFVPEDFEEREIQVKALSAKWVEESGSFVKKKKHNISHLKELGIVFVIPALLGISGEILRMFVLIMHYLYEITFYSDMFKRISKDRSTFTKNFVSLLRGDVPEKQLINDERSIWLVVQRYLTKDDPNDWRLFVPHINPETIHWTNVEKKLPFAAKTLDDFQGNLEFWRDLGWTGDYFKNENGIDVLVSFNVVDTVMTLVRQKEMVKYLYHHQEALWNKIFVTYFGEEQLEKFSREYIFKGYFEI